MTKKCSFIDCKAFAQGKSDHCITHGGGKRCQEPNCKASAQGITDHCITHGGGKRCQEPNCKASARGKSDHCITHGGGKRCQEPNCKASAIGKTDHCKKHGGGKRCQEPNCKASAIGKSDHCITHGGGKRCQEPNCKASAIGKSDHCVTHGGGKRCQEPNCKASARGKSDHCVTHGGGKRCQEPNCKTSAIGKSDHCITHGGGKRCQEPNCKASARGKSDHCIAHGGGKRCPNCKDWPDSRSGCKKYDGYCATCFKNVFPTDPRSTKLRQKGPETIVRNYLNENYTGFIHDHPIYTGNCDCTHRRRIDHRKLIENTMLVTETDERQHKSYDQKDEDIRYDDLMMVYTGKWIFIRFNPDSYIDKKGKRQNPKLETRLKVLKDVIDEQIRRIENEQNTELIEIIKLYYDGY
jgi:hypothetical protein